MVRKLRDGGPSVLVVKGIGPTSAQKLVVRKCFCELTGKLLWHRWTAALRGTVMCRLLNNVSEVVGCG